MGERSMATTGQGNDELEVQKTVTIVGYLKDQSWGDWREWSDEVHGSRDYYEKKESTDVQHYLRGRGFEQKISREEYETLKNNHTGELDVVRESETSQTHKWGAAGGTKAIKDDVTQPLLNMDSLSKYNKNFGKTWKDENDDTVFTVWSSAEDMGLLKHPSEMDTDDPWEDEDADLMAVKFRAKIKKVSEEEAENLNDTAVKALIDGLKENDHIGRVRWTDCETKKVEKGACYNI